MNTLQTLILWPIALAMLGVSPFVSADPSSQPVPDPTQLLRRSDLSRGGGLPGVSWIVRVRNDGGETEAPDMTLSVKAAGTASVSETLEPLRSKGAKMLQVGRAMWLTKPGLRKPVPISPRQRLTGQAAIGDIAATNYARDYAATLSGDELAHGEPCHVLDLKAIDRQATYDRVLYWISKSRGVAVRAEFLSLSGKRLKLAEFDYDNGLRHNDQTLPFISTMTISDELTGARTLLHFSDIRIRRIPASEFDVGHLE